MKIIRRRNSVNDMKVKAAGLILTSASCACDAITTNFAAGCTTSISLIIVAASEVTNSRPKWLMTSLFLPAIQHSGLKTRSHDDDKGIPFGP
jgi:hypothetical protein